MPHIPSSLWVYWVWAVVLMQEAPGPSDDPKRRRLPGETLLLAVRGCANEAAKAAQRAMFTAVVRASWKPDLTDTPNTWGPSKPQMQQIKYCRLQNSKGMSFKFQLWHAPTSHNHPKHDVHDTHTHTHTLDKHTHIHKSEHCRTLRNASCHASNQFPSIYKHRIHANIFFEMIHHLDPFGDFPISSSMILCLWGWSKLYSKTPWLCFTSSFFESGYSRDDAWIIINVSRTWYFMPFRVHSPTNSPSEVSP